MYNAKRSGNSIGPDGCSSCLVKDACLLPQPQYEAYSGAVQLVYTRALDKKLLKESKADGSNTPRAVEVGQACEYAGFTIRMR